MVRQMWSNFMPLSDNSLFFSVSFTYGRKRAIFNAAVKNVPDILMTAREGGDDGEG